MSDVWRSHAPHDRLTRICDAMTTALEAHPEYRDGDRAIVLLDGDGMGGIVLHGYDDTTEAIADLLVHIRALMRSVGKEMDVAFLGDDGITRFVGAPADGS